LRTGWPEVRIPPRKVMMKGEMLIFEGNKRRIVRMVDYEESVVNGNLGDEG
jgi:hypothetical protein